MLSSIRHQTENLTFIAERSENGSLFLLVVSFGALIPVLCPEFILTAAGSLGGGGRGDRSFPAAPGGGTRSMPVFGLQWLLQINQQMKACHFQLMACFLQLS